MKILKYFFSKQNNKNIDEIIKFNSELVKQFDKKKEINLLTPNKDPVTNLEVPQFLFKEKLSKYLQRNGICSGNKAKEYLSKKMVYVNNKLVTENIIINKLDKVTIFNKKGENVPLRKNSRIWMFYKQKGLICTKEDPQKRLTIYDFINKHKLIKNEDYFSIGRLDFNSEGLLLLTNDSNISSTMENPESKIIREYRVRVFGRFNEEKLLNIRKGSIIKGVKYGPFDCDVDKRLTKNTWLKLRLTQGKNHEIRKIMQKNNLQVGRLIRTKFGPYKLGNLKHGNWIEAPIDTFINRKVYMGMRKKAEHVNTENKKIKIMKLEKSEKNKEELIAESYSNLKQIY